MVSEGVGASDVFASERVGDRRDNQSRIADGGEVNPDHAIGEVSCQIVSKRLGQARLTDPAGTGQCQQPHIVAVQQVDNHRQIAFTTQERGQRTR